MLISIQIGSQLTTLGRTMARFPLDPRFTKVILASVEHRCLEEALTVIALLSGESVFMDPIAKRTQASKARERYSICVCCQSIVSVLLSFPKESQWNLCQGAHNRYIIEGRDEIARILTRLCKAHFLRLVK